LDPNKPYKKRILKLLIGFGLLFIFSNSFSQDRVQIFFESGSSKIDEKQKTKLNNLPSKYNLAELDSVWFIGMADSNGRIKSNIRLSKKRAGNVADYCKAIFPKNIPNRISAIGEKQKNVELKDRSVTIFLYFKANKSEEKPSKLDSVPIAKGCYYVANILLAHSNIRTITKGKKEYVLIEVGSDEIDKRDKYYSASEDTFENIKPKQVKWVLRKTGKLNWEKNRYQAMILKQDFKRNKIFYIGSEPCNDCSMNKRNEEDIEMDSCLWEDKFLMENAQVKMNWFNKKYIQLRVPVEYVNIKAPYYFDYDFHQRVKWDRGYRRKNKHYFTTKVPLTRVSRNNYSFNGISRNFPCCIINDTNRHIPYSMNCGFHSGGGGRTINFEIGNSYNQKVNIQYIGLLLNQEINHHEMNLVLGIDTGVHLYGVVRYRYNFISYALGFINFSPDWQNLSNLKLGSRSYSISVPTLNFYLGNELRSGKNYKAQTFLEQSIQLGFYVDISKKHFSRAFVQCGVGYDYFKNNSLKPYSLLQSGLVFYL
jgi:hypothetical protein